MLHTFYLSRRMLVLVIVVSVLFALLCLALGFLLGASSARGLAGSSAAASTAAPSDDLDTDASPAIPLAPPSSGAQP